MLKIRTGLNEKARHWKMVELRNLWHRDTMMFRVGKSGWVVPQYLGMLLRPGTHHVYEYGKQIGYVEVFNQEDATLHLIVQNGRVV